MNVPKRHDNSRVQRFLGAYGSAGDLCRDHPRIDGILSGALALKASGDSATRSLSRQTLFHVLQHCPTIDVASVSAATCGRYAYRSVASYAALARVASKALERVIDGLPEGAFWPALKEDRQRLDAPYDKELQALGLL